MDMNSGLAPQPGGYPPAAYYRPAMTVSAVEANPGAGDRIVALNIANAVFPVGVSWGDGDGGYFSSAPVEHQYVDWSAWWINVSDATGRQVSVHWTAPH